MKRYPKPVLRLLIQDQGRDHLTLLSIIKDPRLSMNEYEKASSSSTRVRRLEKLRMTLLLRTRIIFRQETKKWLLVREVGVLTACSEPQLRILQSYLA